MDNHNDLYINSDQQNYQIVEYVADDNTQQSVSEVASSTIWPPVFDESEFQLFPNEAVGVFQPVPAESAAFQNESDLKAIWPQIFDNSEFQQYPCAAPLQFQTDSDYQAYLDTLPVEEVLKRIQEHYPSSEWPDSTIPQCVNDFSVAAPEGAATDIPITKYTPIAECTSTHKDQVPQQPLNKCEILVKMMDNPESAPSNSIPQKPRRKRRIKKVQTFTSLWNCELCGKAFKSKGGQVQHNQQIHFGPTPHVCNICGKRFRDFDTMEQHRQRHLMKDKPFKCSECPKQFIRRSDLQRHIVLHHSVSPHQCDICGKVFDRADHVTDHKWSHTNGTLKKVKV
ncbi:zinc finger protein 391-like [Aedes aegypti]|uniref:C2H2-type domain-containing protein n=1 Tax=Aedes aegypti TaxID=7159 RepID=A0A6I8U970_AEDAE|nr:zinc finger protein 391-like [Aedes aegypti]